jgi:tetratricopeptide (TPR) repeat protein
VPAHDGHRETTVTDNSAQVDQVEMLKGLIEVPQPEVVLLLEAGYLYMEMGKPKDAEEVFAGVAALLPHSEVPHVALGNLEFAQGHYQRALKHHSEAVKVKPDSALAHAHVGEALLWLKKTDDGKKALHKALELDPEGMPGQFARSLLEAEKDGAIGR